MYFGKKVPVPGKKCAAASFSREKLLGKEAVTLVDFFGYLAAHIGQMEKVIFVHHKKAAVPQGSHCMAHAGL